MAKAEEDKKKVDSKDEEAGVDTKSDVNEGEEKSKDVKAEDKVVDTPEGKSEKGKIEENKESADSKSHKVKKKVATEGEGDSAEEELEGKDDDLEEHSIKKLDVKKILLDGSYVREEDIKKAEEAVKESGGRLDQHLLSWGFITKDILGQAIAEYYKVGYIDLNTKIPAAEQVVQIPEEVARGYYVVLSEISEEKALIATDNPKQEGLANEISEILDGKKVEVGYSLPEDIKYVFRYYRKPLKTRFMEIIDSGTRVAAGIIEAILEDAVIYRTSDIHLEPQEDKVFIRFRIDGVLQIMGSITKSYYYNILNWIKVKAHLRIDEHLSTQDGSIRVVLNNSRIDLRVSIVPVLDGEKIVMRILSRYIEDLTLGGLGMSVKNQNIMNQAAKAPFGMILVTGPTGSGKSTSLYAILKGINSPDLNITTIEDPVEYKIEGVNHIQVNKDTNLTFATGLRSIVRQDPDIILVGEIRDRETAEIGVNAALTGHLLFSTFHANDAPTAVPRLLDMGIEPFLLASTLELIIGQRLIRKICDNCKFSMNKTTKELEEVLPDAKKYFKEKEVTLFKGKGCKACNDSGYSGRTGIFEFVVNTQEMQEVIMSNPSSQEIWDLARKQGTLSFFEDGMIKVKNGISTLEELLRIARV